MKSFRINAFTATALAAALLLSGYTFAQRPETDINPRNHPNLAAAQRYCLQAFQHITDAQQANEWDLGGHAQRAKDLLDQASHELKEAADASNRNERREHH